MNRCREIRKALGLTQAKLAAAAGMSGQNVWLIETGRNKKPRPKTMTAIADALGCAVADAFPDAPPPKAPAEIPSAPERPATDTCRWCGRRYVKDQAAVLTLAGSKIYEAGNLRCLAEYIIENTDRQGNWKKHISTGLK